MEPEKVFELCKEKKDLSSFVKDMKFVQDNDYFFLRCLISQKREDYLSQIIYNEKINFKVKNYEILKLLIIYNFSDLFDFAISKTKNLPFEKLKKFTIDVEGSDIFLLLLNKKYLSSIESNTKKKSLKI